MYLYLWCLRLDSSHLRVKPWVSCLFLTCVSGCSGFLCGRCSVSPQWWKWAWCAHQFAAGTGMEAACPVQLNPRPRGVCALLVCLWDFSGTAGVSFQSWCFFKLSFLTLSFYYSTKGKNPSPLKHQKFFPILLNWVGKSFQNPCMY